MRFQNKLWLHRANPSANRILAMACACLLAMAGAKVFAQTSARPGFDAFRMVQTRNIFDPERQPIRPRQERERPSTPPPTRSSDYASLTGIMVTQEKTLAFFSGTRPDFNKVLPVKGSIAGATVTRIAPNEVEIEREGKKTVLTIGQPLPLGNAVTASSPPAAGNTPAPSPNAPAPGPSPAASEAPATGQPAASPATSGSAPLNFDRDELIKRMMQRRQQETK